MDIKIEKLEDKSTELKKNVIYWLDDENTWIFTIEILETIVSQLYSLAKKYKKEAFGMQPQLTNVTLISGEVVDVIADANFVNGEVFLHGLFLFHPDKIDPKKAREIVVKTRGLRTPAYLN